MLNKLKTLVRGTLDLDKLKKDGLTVGENFHAQEGVIIDPGHCWLIEIGSNVTLAPRVHILAHDASTKKILGYTKIGLVSIGNNVFIGAGAIILPNVKIENNTIIGAGSIVSKNLDSGVYVGNPCKKIYDFEEYVSINKEKIKVKGWFDEKYVYGKITHSMKEEMKNKLKSTNGGYIV